MRPPPPIPDASAVNIAGDKENLRVTATIAHRFFEDSDAGPSDIVRIIRSGSPAILSQNIRVELHEDPQNPQKADRSLYPARKN